jgi:four helix bundle protein
LLSRHDLEERLLEYGANIVRVVGALPRNVVGKRIGDQLLRSGTAVGANYEEARAAESTADFVHKLQISLKELRESHFWLRLLARAEVLPPSQLHELLDESTQLRAILSKAVATTKGKAK